MVAVLATRRVVEVVEEEVLCALEEVEVVEVAILGPMERVAVTLSEVAAKEDLLKEM